LQYDLVRSRLFCKFFVKRQRRKDKMEGLKKVQNIILYPFWLRSAAITERGEKHEKTKSIIKFKG
jgi:hypothetical protein